MISVANEQFHTSRQCGLYENWHNLVPSGELKGVAKLGLSLTAILNLALIDIRCFMTSVSKEITLRHKVYT